VEAGGVVAAVAAMRAWPNSTDVSAAGCAMMLDVGGGGEACTEAVMEAGGAVVAVAALRAHLRYATEGPHPRLEDPRQVCYSHL
jgi:hypothetical protein